MLLCKKERLHIPLKLMRVPFEIKMSNDLRNQLAHLHHGDILPNASPCSMPELYSVSVNWTNE